VQTYYSPDLWKTDAPPEVIYEVLREYKLQQFQGDKDKLLANLKETQPGARILKKEPVVAKNLNFDVKAALEEEQKQGNTEIEKLLPRKGR
jgi:hypothetical protein